jgi:hypothetical protein
MAKIRNIISKPIYIRREEAAKGTWILSRLRNVLITRLAQAAVHGGEDAAWSQFI